MPLIKDIQMCSKSRKSHSKEGKDNNVTLQSAFCHHLLSLAPQEKTSSMTKETPQAAFEECCNLLPAEQEILLSYLGRGCTLQKVNGTGHRERKGEGVYDEERKRGETE